MTISHDHPQSSSTMTRRQVREAERSGSRSGSVAGSHSQPPAATWDEGDDPLSYLTQTRPQVPSYGRSALRDRELTAETTSEGPVEQSPSSEGVDSESVASEGPSSEVADSVTADSEGAAEEPAPLLLPPQEPRLTRRQLRELRFDEMAGGSIPEVDGGQTDGDFVSADTVSRQSPSATSEDAAAGSARPIGHWSIQAAAGEDQEQQNSADRLPNSLGVGTGAITASVLVLPSIPVPNNLMGPLTSTGEVLLTGSVDLPRSLGSTGSHPRLYDRSEVDYLLEATDREDAAADSAPIRAIRAVSTNTPTNGIMGLKNAHGNRLLMVLSVVAAVMAVGVVALFVFGVTFKLF